MVKTTRAQRIALKRVFDRTPLTHECRSVQCKHERAISYREFRKKVQQGFGDYIGIQWCGMWLGIEPDGYTHS